MAISFGDASVNPPPDATPTPSTWGYNANTFSGTISLLDTDGVVQKLVGTLSPIVNLPASTVDNPFFVLINAGKEAIKVNVTGNGSTFSLPANQIVQIFSDGSAQWYGSVTDLSTPVGAAVYWFGGGQTINNYPFDAGQPDPSIGLNNTWVAVRNQWRMPSAGKVVAFSAAHQVSTGTDWGIYKNGVLSESNYDPTSAVERTIGFSTVFSKGDLIGVSQADAQEPQQTRCFIECELPDYAAMLDFAGNPTVNEFLAVNQFYDQPANASYTPYRDAMVMPVAMTLSGFQWYTASASATTFHIWKNGVLAVSVVTTTITNGVIAVGPISYAVGDQIAITHIAGTIPGAGRYQLLFDGTKTKFYRWGGDAPAGWNFASWGLAITPGTGNYDYVTKILMPSSGTVVGVGAVCQIIRTADVQLFKNGALSENIASIGSLITVDTAMTTTFVRGDYLNIHVPVSGADGNDSNYLLAVR